MSEKSSKPGSVTSDVEVTNLSTHGFWLFLAGRELFVSFEKFPWFAQAAVSKIVNVQRPSADHLYWPELDIDLSIRSIEKPDDFPLISVQRD